LQCLLVVAALQTMLLDYAFNMQEESKLIENAVAQSIEQGICTEDLKQEKVYGTKEVGDYIVSQLKSAITV
jgi:3-isopropylmalate dehydrogenase